MTQPSPGPAGTPAMKQDKLDDDGKSPDEIGLRKKKKKSKWNYEYGDIYPGLNFGHAICNAFNIKTHAELIPARQGWAWNLPDDFGGQGRGTCGGGGGSRAKMQQQHMPTFRPRAPGTIAKSVIKLMGRSLKTSTFSGGGRKNKKDKKKKKKRGMGGLEQGGGDSGPDEPLFPKPALKVQRKGDVFTIQVNPLKDLTKISHTEDPYVDCDPMVFKIIKKRSEDERARCEAKKIVKLKKQRDAEIRKALSEAVEDICKCAYMDVFCNDLTAIDKKINSCPAFKEPDCVCKDESLSSLSSNASWDIEYTPPFGCFDISASRKPRKFVHTDTQYCLADIGVPEPEPKCRKCCATRPCCCCCSPTCR